MSRLVQRRYNTRRGRAVSTPSIQLPAHTDSAQNFRHPAKLYTGDAGFLYEGELFIIGRLGDSVKVRGKSVFAEDTDATLHSIAGLGTHNAVSLLGFLEDQESIIALVEKPAGEWVAEVAEQLSAQYTSMRVVVIAADRGTLMRTTSGKPRRTTMWQHVLERWDAKEVAFDSATGIEPSG